VVGLRVGDDERVEPADPGAAELRRDAVARGSRVDQDRVAAGLEQRGVALADVERGDAEVALGRRGERARRDEGGPERGGEG